MREPQKHPTVLSWINRLRDAIDEPPLPEIPAGERRNARGCPVARAIPIEGVRVDSGRIGFPVEAGVKAHRIRSRLRLRRSRDQFRFGETFGGPTMIFFDVPAQVRSFVRMFDARRMPELDVRTPEGRDTLRRQRAAGIQSKRR